MLRLQISLPHEKQRHDWDCGLACVKMILQRIRSTRFSQAEFENVCKKLGFGSSVWTIDLANILTYYELNYSFYTETIGVDMAYQTSSFYSEAFDLDEVRVNSLFTSAQNIGIHVEKRTISLEEIILKLNCGQVAIALTNAYFLQCDWCQRMDSFSPIGMLMLSYCTKCTSSMDNYCGHFIVICGYDMKKKCFYYKNPSSDKELCCMNFHAFEAAWRCYGTDCDIIFVDVEQASTQLTQQLRPVEVEQASTQLAQQLRPIKPDITCGIQEFTLEAQVASA